MSHFIEALQKQYPEKRHLQPFVDANQHTPWLNDVAQKHERKLCAV